MGNKNGIWLINSDGYYPYCSECNYAPKDGDMTNFCPNCGTNMRHWDNDLIKENYIMNTNNFMNTMFGKIAPGMCRLGMNGGIAVKTDNGYKTYNVKTGRLVNCNNFVFDIGEDLFFLIPTNKVHKGDIILINNKPKCVINVEDNSITVINYQDSTIETVLPERHVFMGNSYFYGKIVSMFGDSFTNKNGGMNNVFKYMMMSEMLKSGGTNQSGMNNILPLMMFGNGGFENMFDGMFDFDEITVDEEDSESEVEE